MRVRDRPGDYPTVKLSVEEVARYAREADARVLEEESRGRRSTLRPEPDPDIEVTVELAESGADTVGAQPDLDPFAKDDARSSKSDYSDIRPAARGEDPGLLSVPCVVAAKEDLAWFQLDETSHVVLAMIDGESTVEDIVSTLSLPRASTLGILRELGTHGVVEFR